VLWRQAIEMTGRPGPPRHGGANPSPLLAPRAGPDAALTGLMEPSHLPRSRSLRPLALVAAAAVPGAAPTLGSAS